MGALLRAHNWADTELGPPETWPQSLKTAVGLLLNSGYPMYIGWGPNFIQIYNDAYRPILGDTKHPAALGRSTQETFAEIWDIIGPMFQTVLEQAKATTFTDHLLFLNRFGFPEECYFVFSYSPVLLESGEAGGVFVTCLETTDRVLRERRQRVLRDVAAIHAQSGRAQIFASAVQVIASDREDVPLIAICTREPGSGWTISAFNGPDDTPDVVLGLLPKTHTYAGPHDPVVLPKGLSCEPWPEDVTSVIYRPILPPGGIEPVGIVVYGLSPRLHWNDDYRTFIDTCTLNLASVIADAEAFDRERQRAQALADFDKAKTVFFSNVSHEFRTPLTLMLGPLEDTLADPTLIMNSAQRGRLETAHRNSARVLKLVNSLLDFSRMEAGRAKAYFQATNLNQYTEDLISSFRSAMEKAGLTLTVINKPLPQTAYVDREMWENIVLNLMSNAFKFTLEGEVNVEITASDDQRSAVIKIRDTGVGIPAGELPRLFERFHRIEGVHGRTIEGSGIGLALVQELVHLHGGKLEVESQVGRGSTFTIAVPLGSDHLPGDHIDKNDQPAQVGSRSRGFVAEALRWLPASPPEGLLAAPNAIEDLPSPPGARGDCEHHILIVDDNADMRDYIRHLLEAGGYRVDVASDGLAALAILDQELPDLVLSDAMMPRLDGFGLLRQLRDRPDTLDLPFVMLSARAGDEAKADGLDAGADDYIVKPFSAREMLARVGSAIELAKVRRRTAEAVREEYARFRHLFDQSPGFMATLRGPEHVFEFTNAAYVRLVGDRNLIGRTVKDAIPEVASQGFIEILDQVYNNEERFVGENVRVKLQTFPDARLDEHFVNFVYEPVRDADGSVTGIFVEGHDVTVQARQQRHLQLLVNELNHRVKNTLAIVQAIGQQTFKNGALPETALPAFNGRLTALAAAHDLLTRQNWESTDLGAVAKEVLGAQNGYAARIEMGGPPVDLLPKSAVTVAMAMHELCTNAVKYGSLSAENGRVKLRWSTYHEKEPRLRINWQETGGPHVVEPTRRGFGMRLVKQALAAELGAEVRLEFRPDGLRCEIDAPLPKGTGQ